MSEITGMLAQELERLREERRKRDGDLTGQLQQFAGGCRPARPSRAGRKRMRFGLETPEGLRLCRMSHRPSANVWG